MLNPHILNVPQRTPRANERKITVRVDKENITDKILKIKRYSKWLLLMQLPKVFPALNKYGSFDYHAHLMKEK